MTKQQIFIRGGVFLDIGCGNGFFSNVLIQDGLDVFGVDYDKELIDIANLTYRKNSGNKDERFYVSDIGEKRLPDPISSNSFSCILSTEVIEHLYSPDNYLSFCHSILEDRGTIIISTPYHGWLKNVLIAVTNRWDYHHRTLLEGSHIKFFSKITLRSIIERNGFRIRKMYGIGRVPFLWNSIICVSEKVED